MICLENEYLKVTIAAKGAELQSLFDKTTQTEKLWSGDPAYWGKKSPVLFPIVGALKDDTYYYNGHAYHLSRHGFARDMVFDVSFANDHEAVFTLSDTLQTFLVYPFKFNLSICYRLQNAILSCTFKVLNTGETPMLFSIGAHPAFAISTGRDKKYTGYTLKFNRDKNLKVYKINDNLIDEEAAFIDLPSGDLKLKHQLFYNDALVIKNLQSNCVTILNDYNGHGLNFRFNAFPYFGIWAARDADFVCLEPWCGIADAVTHNQQLTDKEGINRLSGGDAWERSWAAEVF